jgi:ribosomal-protein-alanine N-acetyltransferase
VTTVAIRISALRKADLPRCVELERTLFPGEDPWSLAVFAAELRAC